MKIFAWLYLGGLGLLFIIVILLVIVVMKGIREIRFQFGGKNPEK